MVKSKVIQPEYVQEFVNERIKVAAARKKAIGDLEQLIKDIAPKLKDEYILRLKKSFQDFDVQMKFYEFLKLSDINVASSDIPAPNRNAKEVGIAFIEKYYEGLVRGPEGVMELFYNDSVYVGSNGKEVRGLEDIRSAIDNNQFNGGKIVIESVHAVFTGLGGIMVQSIANYVADDSTQYSFSESFHLVPRNKKWCIQSCLFKWHDESLEDAEN